MRLLLLRFLPPVGVLAMALLGGKFSAAGVEGWYRTIALPSWTPPGSVIGAVWTVIYVLTMYAGYRYFSQETDRRRANAAAAVFILNVVLNIGWSWLFFDRHLIFAAFWEALALEASVLALIALFRRASPAPAAMLVPYAAWVAFASFLTYAVHLLNR